MDKMRLNLTLHTELYEQLSVIADDRNISLNALLQSFIKIGLLANECSKNDDMALILKEGDKQREIMFL